jgi:hypothetical protein
MEEDHLEVVDAQHLGFVQLFEPDGDPVFIERAQAVFSQNPEAIRVWDKCPAPGPGASSIQIPRLGLTSSPCCLSAQKHIPGPRNCFLPKLGMFLLNILNLS